MLQFTIHDILQATDLFSLSTENPKGISVLLSLKQLFKEET